MASIDNAVVLRWEKIQFRAPQSTLRSISNLFLKAPKDDRKLILDGISGNLRAGQMMAIMGPSGAGKSTLLDILSQRSRATTGHVVARDAPQVKDVSAYVEQDDSLLGTLTVRETLWYSAKLGMPRGSSNVEIKERVENVIQRLGLESCSSNWIGTPVKRGISGGQKRRVTIGCSLVNLPAILFLDEPTSGLDIHTAFTVMDAIKGFATAHNIAVCATIHSPNWNIFKLFDAGVLLLARGKTVYSGPVDQVAPYFESIGHPCPRMENPADHMLRLAADDPRPSASDVTQDEKGRRPSSSLVEKQNRAPHHMASHWCKQDRQDDDVERADSSRDLSAHRGKSSVSDIFFDFFSKTWTLTKRNTVNYSRNMLAYGIRFGMYLGMGVLLATVWVDLPETDSHVQDRLSVHFFSVAFLGFMSVAGIPSFLEERSVLMREMGNRLYGPAPYTVSTTLVILPFLFACSLTFAVICYWSIGLHPGGSAFFRWLLFLYLGVLAAEMQSLLIAATIPIFVAALAVAAFLNGFWMCTQGYFIRTTALPRFWYYWAHFINYETYAFDLLAATDLEGLSFPCARDETGDPNCQWPAFKNSPDAASGTKIVEYLSLDVTSYVGQALILLCIAIIYRLMFYGVLRYQQRH